LTDSCRYVLGNGLCGNYKQYEKAYCDEHMKKTKGHLSSSNLTYIDHWQGAFKMSMALLIHAFFPNKLDHYVSDRLMDRQEHRLNDHENDNFI